MTYPSNNSILGGKNDVPRPGESLEDFNRRTGRGFFLPGPVEGATGSIGGITVPLTIPKKGEGPGILDSLKHDIRIKTPWPQQGEPMYDPPKVSEPSADPAVYYNGTEALDKMVQTFGLAATITWCRMTAYKYSLRMGKKAGNSVEQEAEKIAWYLAAAERLTNQAYESGRGGQATPAASGSPTPNCTLVLPPPI